MLPSAELRHLLRRALVRGGYSVREAPDGCASCEAFVDRPADLVICDMMMPGRDGIETILKLTGISPGLKVIAISGASAFAERFLSLALTFGAQRAPNKPFGRAELGGIVRELLEEGELATV